MARPAKFDREQAVELVMNEIWQTGYQANSVKALSEKLGITRSSFYNAFGNREKLFDEVLALYVSGSPDKAFSTATQDMSIKHLFTDTFANICKIRAADPKARGCLAVNSITELCNTNDQLGPQLETVILGSIKRITILLSQGIASGELPKDMNPHITAMSVQNLIIGLNVLCKLVPDEQELWNIARTTLRGLGLLEEV